MDILASDFYRILLMSSDLHTGPMGVSAIFISTLALSRLPEPNDTPANQTEILAASLHPIVSFVVLCSIIIRKSVDGGTFILYLKCCSK